MHSKAGSPVQLQKYDEGPLCILQVALEGGGEDFLPKAWGKFH